MPIFGGLVLTLTDGSITLNTGGLAFCIIFPDGNIKNVQDTQCRFIIGGNGWKHEPFNTILN